jgi:hypothetical protein
MTLKTYTADPACETREVILPKAAVSEPKRDRVLLVVRIKPVAGE